MLEPGDLVLQGLVAGVQVAVVEAQPLDLLLQSIDLAGQIRDQLAQGRRGQRLVGTPPGGTVIHRLDHEGRSAGVPCPLICPGYCDDKLMYGWKMPI